MGATIDRNVLQFPCRKGQWRESRIDPRSRSLVLSEAFDLRKAMAAQRLEANLLMVDWDPLKPIAQLGETLQELIDPFTKPVLKEAGLPGFA